MKKLMKLSLLVLVLGLALSIGGKAAGGRLYSINHGRIQPVDWSAIRNELHRSRPYFDWYVSRDGLHFGWFDDDCRARDWDDRYDPEDWFVPYDPEDCCGPDDWDELPDIPLYDS